MADILRGVVTNIVDGDTFDLRVLEVRNGDQEKYDDVERIRINNLSADEEPTDANEEGYVEPDEEEMDGTPEEATLEAGSADTTRFFDVRDIEDLEIKIKGREVICEVTDRTLSSVLVADVTIV